MYYNSLLQFLGCSFCLANLCTEHLQDKLAIGAPRTDEETRELSQRIGLLEETDAPRVQVDNLERDTGVRYSILHKLPYHKPISNHVVEPMHNLLLGKDTTMFAQTIIHGENMHQSSV